MKMKLLCVTILLWAAMAPISNASAQQSGNIAANEPTIVYSKKSLEADLEKNFFTAAREAKIDIKIARDFSNRFGFVENVRWHKIYDGTLANFSHDGKPTRSAYNAYGRWMYNLTSVNEWQFSKVLRAQVKSVYYDHNITLVEEITNMTQQYYIVHLHANMSWIKLRLCDGEMEVMEELMEP